MCVIQNKSLTLGAIFFTMSDPLFTKHNLYERAKMMLSFSSKCIMIISNLRRVLGVFVNFHLGRIHICIRTHIAGVFGNH